MLPSLLLRVGLWSFSSHSYSTLEDLDRGLLLRLPALDCEDTDLVVDGLLRGAELALPRLPCRPRPCRPLPVILEAILCIREGVSVAGAAQQTRSTHCLAMEVTEAGVGCGWASVRRSSRPLFGSSRGRGRDLTSAAGVVGGGGACRSMPCATSDSAGTRSVDMSGPEHPDWRMRRSCSACLWKMTVNGSATEPA